MDEIRGGGERDDGIAAGPARAIRPRLAAIEWTILGLCGLVLLVVSVWLAGRWGRTAALDELRRSAEISARLHAAALGSELQKQRAVPFVLAQDSDVKAALRASSDSTADVLNRKLEALSGGTQAAVIYVLDAAGTTVAASNWRLPTSFVGQNYSFRAYYREAMADDAHEHFAMGTVSQHPGYYFARRVEDPQGALGVVVVKVEFDALEADWRRGGSDIFVAGPDGVVLITDIAGWRFRTVQPLPDERLRALRESMQYGEALLDPLPLVHTSGSVLLNEDLLRGRFLLVKAPVPTVPWTTYFLAPFDPVVRRSEEQARLIAALCTIVAMSVVALLLHRRHAARRRRQQEEEIRRELEVRVVDRTAELSETNRRLEGEITERRRAEAMLRNLQDELVQANKLATLGQIAASVAHEVNQPLAAIRAYADNAGVFLARERTEEVGRNLSSIASLTDRIGEITSQLRAFSRKASGKLEPVSLRGAITGSLMLIEHRLRRQGVALRQEIPDGEVSVLGELVRLEQVLVNLLQNALDALAGTPRPEIVIAVERHGDRVLVSVADNGPGIAPEILADLFQAFATTKPEGLGLGLAISREIVQEFGGALTAANKEAGGAVFTIDLSRAD